MSCQLANAHCAFINPEDRISTEDKGPKKSLATNLPEFDNDVRRPEFSFLDNWSAEKQPATNWYKFNSDDRTPGLPILQFDVAIAVELNAGLHAGAVVDVDLSNVSNADRYAVPNRVRIMTITMRAVQYIMYVSMLLTISKIKFMYFKYTIHVLRLSITFFASQQFY
jgi:hypothetical protein